jgi:hypothetical protein
MAVSPRQYYAIKNNLTKKEKELIDFYELQWFLRHNVPTIDEVAKQIEQTQVSVNHYLTRAPVIKALEKRGIPWRQHSQSELTSQQVATAIVMMNFVDTRSNKDKLDQLGINESQYYAWLNDPQFKNLINNLKDQNLANIEPTAITEFTKKINQGDWQAVKFYLETTGAMQSTEQPQSAQLISMIVEIIQRHVKDETVMNAIAADILMASGNRTLEMAPQQEITSYVVDAPEVVDAKKQLGIG